MTKAVLLKKQEEVSKVAEELKSAASVVVVDYLGLTHFVGPTAIVFSESEVVAPAKVIAEFAKKAEKLEIKGGLIEGKAASAEDVKALAALPDRDGLLSMLLSVLQAPVRNTALAIKAVAEAKESAA